MSITETLLIALGVSVDAAAVSVSGALCPGKYSKRRCAFNAALFFGGFQFLMPLTGAVAAGFLSGIIGQFGNYAAFVLLTAAGGKMLWEAYNSDAEKESCPLGDFFSVKNLILPAIATSIDALAIGAGLHFSGEKILFPALIMGCVTAIISASCVLLSKILAEKYTANARILTAAGGIVIIAIGVKIILQHWGMIPEF